ncbi:hypothetical protein ACIRD3_34135 [Kitasatospora sp. NPDC093550]|uniref:hypothetical protein n=1 Tax=Kitasatospora sp. NPDC093550 TaxID=3364089 RepID=UPI0037F45430
MRDESGDGPGSRWAAYEWWQTRLAEAFFGGHRKDTPVLFFINDNELRELQGSAEVQGLSTAVSSVLGWHGDPYQPVSDRCRVWKRGKREDPPPCLPLLATAVLAAARMQRTEAGPGAPAYYARLAEVLCPSWGGERHRKPLESNYEAVVGQWLCLDEWLREQGGARGLSTIRRNPALRKIGYAQSQALVRASDHAALRRFFRSENLSPGQEVHGRRLLEKLQMWSSVNPGGLSQRLRQALGSHAEGPLLEPLLVTLFEGWDGSTNLGHGSSGLPQVRLRVVLEDEFTGWEARWHAEAVSDVEHDLLRHPAGALEIALADQVYELSGAIPDLAQALQHGLCARGAVAEACVEGGRSVLALREDPLAGGWTETDVLTALEPYVFLFNPSGQGPLQSLLADAGHQWRCPEPVPVPGWQVTPELRFDDEQALAAALSRSAVGSVRHHPQQRLSLRNGLLVERGWRHRSLFLLGGEPDAMVPEAYRRPGLVTLDGQPLAVPPDGLTVLRGKGLAPGRHVLAAGGTAADFYLASAPEPLADAPGGPVPGAPPGTVAVPLGGDVRFLTAQGHFLAARRPQEPAWWRDRAPALCGGGTARIPVPPGAVWLVAASGAGEPAVTLLQPQEPDFGSLSRAAKDYWSRLVLLDLAGTAHSTLWKRYREAALSQFPRGGFTRV